MTPVGRRASSTTHTRCTASDVHQIQHLGDGGGVLARHHELGILPRERNPVRRRFGRVHPAIRIKGNPRYNAVDVDEVLSHGKREGAEGVALEVHEIRLDTFPTTASVPSSTIATAWTFCRSIS